MSKKTRRRTLGRFGAASEAFSPEPEGLIVAENGWTPLVEPGLIAARKLGKGRLIACALDPDELGAARVRVKALRVWNTLLTNLSFRRNRFESFLQPALKLCESNPWEQMPPHIGW